jgi:hypothetical protein
MSYIGVSPQNQDYFHNRVSEVQNKFYDYVPPTTKESYWETVNYYWPQIKNILLEYTLLEKDELDILLKDKNPEITTVFNDAWFNAPDDGKIHLISAWHIFCDLCSESYLLHEN